MIALRSSNNPVTGNYKNKRKAGVNDETDSLPVEHPYRRVDGSGQITAGYAEQSKRRRNTAQQIFRHFDVKACQDRVVRRALTNGAQTWQAHN